MSELGNRFKAEKQRKKKVDQAGDGTPMRCVEIEAEEEGGAPPGEEELETALSQLRVA